MWGGAGEGRRAHHVLDIVTVPALADDEGFSWKGISSGGSPSLYSLIESMTHDRNRLRTERVDMSVAHCLAHSAAARAAAASRCSRSRSARSRSRFSRFARARQPPPSSLRWRPACAPSPARARRAAHYRTCRTRMRRSLSCGCGCGCGCGCARESARGPEACLCASVGSSSTERQDCRAAKRKLPRSTLLSQH